MNVDSWVPLRWPCGDLEIERAKRRPGFTAPEAEALREACRPRVLEPLEGGPVNCLVVTWAEGSPLDEAHQRALSPLVSAAESRGVQVVGWVSEPADLRRAASAARAAGLAALATPSGQPVEGANVLRFRRRSLAPLDPTGFLGDADAVWPGMRAPKPAGDADAVSGATSRPWIDSNVWSVRLARSLLAPRAQWLAFDPPETGEPVAADAYVQAIADTEIGGGRWMVSLDSALRTGLLAGQAAARDTWSRMGRSLAFFRAHGAWAAYTPVGQIGVVSDFTGENEPLAFEVLNLLSRRSSLYRVLEKDRALTASFGGLDGIVYVDGDRPEEELARKLYDFAARGGTLVTPPGWQESGPTLQEAAIPRFRVSRFGRGRLAVAREPFEDPDLLAEDAQLLTSHRHDRVRVFNLGVGQFHHATSADGRSGVLHTLAFPTSYRRGPMTAWFRKPWASARFLTVDAEAAVAAPRATVEAGAEFHLPPAPIYCALEVSE